MFGNVQNNYIFCQNTRNPQCRKYTTLGGANYSTTEINTGTTWLDGKDIYSKTIQLNHISGSNYTSLGLSNVDSYVYYEFKLTSDNSSDSVTSATHTSDTDYIRVFIKESNGTVQWRLGTGNPVWSGYITVFYTKTTDKRPVDQGEVS